MSHDVHLYSMQVCPFAQRTRVMLRMKDISFELTELDISKPRPDWFLEKNPLGKVPVIEHDGRIINESSVINEYLDEVFDHRRVHSEDPYRRAISRILIDYCNNGFVGPMYGMLMNQDPDKHDELHEKVLETWRWVDDFLMRYNPDGTYLFDEDGYGMAEVTFAPFFARYVLNEYYLGFELPDTDEYARVRRWRDACVDNEHLQATSMSDEDFIKLYFDYSRGFGNGAVPEGQAYSSFDTDVPLEGRPMPPKKFGLS